MGRNAQRRKRIQQELADMASNGIEINRVAKVLSEEGFQAAEIVQVNVNATEGYEITCDDCGSVALIPYKPDPMPDRITCPHCMRGRIARS